MIQIRDTLIDRSFNGNTRQVSQSKLWGNLRGSQYWLQKLLILIDPLTFSSSKQGHSRLQLGLEKL